MKLLELKATSFESSKRFSAFEARAPSETKTAVGIDEMLLELLKTTTSDLEHEWTQRGGLQALVAQFSTGDSQTLTQTFYRSTKLDYTRLFRSLVEDQSSSTPRFGIYHVDDRVKPALGELPSWYSSVVSKILELGDLKKGWYYSSPPPSRGAIKQSLSLVGQFLLSGLELTPPIATAEGSISFRLSSTRGVVEIEADIDGDFILSVRSRDAERSQISEHEGTKSVVETVIEFLNQ